MNIFAGGWQGPVRLVNKALLVGINQYPGNALNGCVNDISDMASFLTKKCGFASNEIRLLTDQRATTSEIKNQLIWLTSGAKVGDRILFHYSGHGAQVASMDRRNNVSSLAEVICPIDFDWSPEHMITDQDFIELFSVVPVGVEFVWISDSCHSGGLDREMAQASHPNVLKRMIPPVDIAWKVMIAKEANMNLIGINKSASLVNAALIAGCKSEQTSADAYFSGRYNGALTYFLLKELNKADGLEVPLSVLVPRVVMALKQSNFDQEPQLDGLAQVEQKSFLAK